MDRICLWFLADNKLNRLVTKPTKWLCAQRRLRSAWAPGRSDESLRCALNGQLRTQAFFMRTANTLIRLGGCPGWSESSMGAQPHFWFCHEAAQLFLKVCGCHTLVSYELSYKMSVQTSITCNVKMLFKIKVYWKRLISPQSLSLDGRRGTTDDVASEYHSTFPWFPLPTRNLQIPFLSIIWYHLSYYLSCAFHFPVQNCVCSAKWCYCILLQIVRGLIFVGNVQRSPIIYHLKGLDPPPWLFWPRDWYCTKFKTTRNKTEIGPDRPNVMTNNPNVRWTGLVYFRCKAWFMHKALIRVMKKSVFGVLRPGKTRSDYSATEAS